MTSQPETAHLKRKERDCDEQKPSQAEPARDNQLLAGYLAHEFLTRGTLFGQSWDPSRAADPAPHLADPAKKPRPSGGAPQASSEACSRYADVAHLLKTGGAHLPEIINPTQLHRWIQM